MLLFSQEGTGLNMTWGELMGLTTQERDSIAEAYSSIREEWSRAQAAAAASSRRRR